LSRRKSRGRTISGILLLDKPAGITSNGALQKVKALFGAAKAGHTGSLDPLATGMLPICFGEATKFSQFLLDADKIYRVSARLGMATDTGDADGTVIVEHPVTVSESEVFAALADFEGESAQIPSMYSAIKHRGEPLYRLARQGIEVVREPRPIRIDYIRPEGLLDNELRFELRCSKGTYVRTLVEDLGKVLGCGAHVTMLRRLRVGPYPVDEMVTLDELGALREQGGFESLDRKLLPLSTSVADWPRAELGDTAASYLCQGQAVVADARPNEGKVSIYEASSGRFLGVGEILDDGRVAPSRLVASPGH